jgi:predicted outer membrane repeat protein
MRPTDSELVTISTDNLTAVSGGAIYAGGKCIAGCSGQNTQPGQGITAEELWRDQLRRKRRY